jgi:hypothetical protein
LGSWLGISMVEVPLCPGRFMGFFFLAENHLLTRSTSAVYHSASSRHPSGDRRRAARAPQGAQGQRFPYCVQVVPAASYVIAMANKPKARALASTLPREPTISDDGNRRAQPHWPHAVASVAPDHSVLPVPDASAFEPDAVASQEITDVHWPAQAEAKRPPPAKSQVLAPRKHKFAGRSEKRKARIAHAGQRPAAGGPCAST